jgi:DNA-directed RNA polymerase subunit RPC12/RpoP
MPLACPRCGSRNLRPSQYRNVDERINSFRFISPLRCKDCRTRFVSRTVILKDLLYARCPQCARMDLNGWTGKTHQPNSWTLIKIALGAFRWRCEYCRVNFASFRQRRESFTFSRWKNLKPDLVAEKPEEVVVQVKPKAKSASAG